MKYMEKRDRSQISFLPECVEDTISDENPVRVIDAFVDSLDMEGLGFQKAKPAQTGRPAYDPRDLLKLYLYGYLNRIRSSRMLMRECRRNIELFYLLGGLKPDFRTIADFRKDNAQAIRNCFRAFGKLCVKLGLYNRELLAVDGTKIRAVNSKDNCYNQKVVEKKLAHIDEKLSAYLAALDEEDKADRGTETAAEKIKVVFQETWEMCRIQRQGILPGMQEQVHPWGVERGQFRPGDGLCAGTDVRDSDRGGTGNPAGCKDQPEQPYAGYGTCAEKEGRAADTGRQRKAKAANVPFGASVWNGEVVPGRTLFAVQGKGESRSGAGAEFPCL